ncbi:MAG: TonB-dependent receptor plug domain-containing protein, partial [Vicinamibacteria bacterium]
VPGVEVARIDSNKWAVGVRGFGTRLSKSVLVLIDGRSVYTTLFAGVYWDAQDTLLEDVDRIEVIRGPGGTIWGPNAVNGVINIITRDAKDTHGVLATASVGNLDEVSGAFRYGGATGNGIDYRAYGKAFGRDAQYHVDGNDFDDWWMAEAGFRVDRHQSRDHWTLQGDLYRGDAGNRLAVSAYSPPSITNVQGDAELSGGNLLGRFRRTLDSGGNLQFLAYYDRASRSDLNFAEVRNTFDLDFLHQFTWRKQGLIWGGGVRFVASDPRVVGPTVVWEPNDFTDKLFTAFVQDEIPFAADRARLTLGAKFLHNNYTGLEVQPTARLLWMPSPRQSVWGAVTHAVRTPSRVDEHLRFTALFFPQIPMFLRLTGEDIDSENLLGYEVGYRSLVSDELFIDAAAFFNDYDDLLSVEPGTPFLEASPAPEHLVLPVLFANQLQGTSSGFEIAPVWNPRPWLRLKGAYSLLDLQMETEPGSADASTVRQIEGSSPRHQVVLQSFLQLPRSFELDLTYRYVSALSSRMTDSYNTMDLRWSWAATESLELSFAGQNLFNAHHREFTSDPGPPVEVRRSFYAKITLRR